MSNDSREENIASSTLSHINLSPLSTALRESDENNLLLDNLKDRIASLNDRVRYLENENKGLRLQVTTKEAISNEKDVSNIYVKELEGVRQLLDETKKEMAKIQLEAGRSRAELGELTQKLKKANKKFQQLKTRNNELNASLLQLETDLAKAIEENTDVISERDKLAKQVPELQQQLATEQLARTDLENRNRTQKADYMLKQEVIRLHEEQQARLQSTLQELRDQYESQIQQSRDEVEVLYHNKVKDLEDEVKKQRNSATSHYEELISARNCLKDATLKLSELELANSQMKETIAELELNLETQRREHASAMQDASAVYSSMQQEERTRLRAEIASQFHEKEDSKKVKITRLLQGEDVEEKTTEADESGNLVNKILEESRQIKKKSTRKKNK